MKYAYMNDVRTFSHLTFLNNSEITAPKTNKSINGIDLTKYRYYNEYTLPKR